MAFRDAAYHITRDTADLYVEAVGPEDGQPVYYLHGGPGYNSFSFRDLLGDSLEEQLLLYADQRGGGRSYAEAPFSFEVLADDVRSVLQALDISSASLLGHGFGAAIAVEVAATWPELVDRLILVNPWFSMPLLARTVQRTAAVLSGHEALALPAENELQEGEAGDPADLTDQAFSWIAAKRVFDELQFPNPSARLQLEHSDSAALSGPTEPVELIDPWHVDVLDRLELVRAPMVLIAGQHDRSCMPDQIEAGLSRLPQALFSMTHGGHYPWLDDPENFLSLFSQALTLDGQAT